jgi:NAD(P)-dependent dehydrogenase (short-subunit alcohol dehydrogenase family)
MDMGLKDRVVLVTGSSSGIGRATAIAFGRERARVGITYHQQRQDAEQTARQVIEAGGEATVISYDLAREDSITAAVEAIVARWGTIHVLVNNAVQWGTFRNVLFENMPISDWKTMLDLGLTGVYQTLQKVVPFMRAQHWGRIINVSSNIAEDGMSGASAYASTKAGLHGLTRVLAQELASVGILSNAVLPGFTVTERNSKIFPQEMRDTIAQQRPTGRLTTPEDVASLIVYLGSNANGHVNGELIRCTGG